MHRALIVTLLFPTPLLAAPPDERQVFDVSDDGRSTAFPGLIAQTPAFSARGGGVPFPLSPDFQLDLRRQVGGLQIADMNGDGHNDIVVGCYTSNSFPPFPDYEDFILYNPGDGSDLGSWAMWISDNETHTGDVQVGDLNADGHNDLVTVHGGGLTTSSVRVYPGAPGGPATTAVFVSATPQTVWGTAGELFDVDNDGDLDLATTNQAFAPSPDRPIYLFENVAGALNPVPAWQSADTAISNGLDAYDIDNDGDLDLAVAKWVNYHTGVYLNDGGVLETLPAIEIANDDGERGVAVADYDDDGIAEIAIGSDPITLHEITPPTLTLLWTGNPPFASAAQDLRAFDVDGDGDQDLAEIIFGDGRAHIYINRSGVPDTNPTWTYDAPQTGTAMAFGDINGDGVPDLVTGYSGDTCLRVFLAVAPDCPADFATPEGSLDFNDVVAFLSAFSTMDPSADLAEPFGAFDFNDVVAYLGLFAAGCP